MNTLKVKKLSHDAKLPARAEEDSAGLDIYTNEDYVLKSGETHAFSTGISTEFASGLVALIWDRSGLGAKGVHRLAGVIDSSYRGEWKIVLHNLTLQKVKIKAGDRIAQCLIQKYEVLAVKEVNELSDSERGEGGFGSSGR